MKVFKTVLGFAIAGVLLVGWQKDTRAEEVTGVVKETPVVETAPVTPAPAAEAPAPVISAPAAEVVAPVAEPAVTENKEEKSQAIVLSVADLYAKKAEVKDKNVTISGKVVKANYNVMGKNWIHVQDGTGSQGTNDITVTTAGQAKVNDKVTVSGIVAVDRDFGGGYKYSVIIEEAVINIQ